MRQRSRSIVTVVASKVIAIGVFAVCLAGYYSAFRYQNEYIKSVMSDTDAAQAPSFVDDLQAKNNTGANSLPSLRNITTTPLLAGNGATDLSVPREHPHTGARYPNGSWGYVADISRIRRWMLDVYRHETQGRKNNEQFNDVESLPQSYLPISRDESREICDTPPKQGSEKKAGWRLLANKLAIFNETDSDPRQDSGSTIDKSSLALDRKLPRVKLLCAIYTYEKKHDHVRAIAETWGWRCGAFQYVAF